MKYAAAMMMGWMRMEMSMGTMMCVQNRPTLS